MRVLIKEQQESYGNAKISNICEEKYLKHKKYRKAKYHFNSTGEYKGAAHSICNLRYSVPKRVPIFFYNGSNYDYHFIIKPQKI